MKKMMMHWTAHCIKSNMLKLMEEHRKKREEKAEREWDPVEAEHLQTERAEKLNVNGNVCVIGNVVEAILEQRSKKREEIMKFENAEELLDAKREQNRVHNLVHYSRKKRDEISLRMRKSYLR